MSQVFYPPDMAVCTVQARSHSRRPAPATPASPQSDAQATRLVVLHTRFFGYIWPGESSRHICEFVIRTPSRVVENEVETNRELEEQGYQRDQGGKRQEARPEVDGQDRHGSQATDETFRAIRCVGGTDVSDGEYDGCDQ
jgi:hypothetical protein